jgi:hypothetical protein
MRRALARARFQATPPGFAALELVRPGRSIAELRTRSGRAFTPEVGTSAIEIAWASEALPFEWSWGRQIMRRPLEAWFRPGSTRFVARSFLASRSRLVGFAETADMLSLSQSSFLPGAIRLALGFRTRLPRLRRWAINSWSAAGPALGCGLFQSLPLLRAEAGPDFREGASSDGHSLGLKFTQGNSIFAHA